MPKKSNVPGKGRWTDDEERLFAEGFSRCGWGEWNAIAKMIPTRTNIQVKTHAQKVLRKQHKEEKSSQKYVKKMPPLALPESTSSDADAPAATNNENDTHLPAEQRVHAMVPHPMTMVKENKYNFLRKVSDLTSSGRAGKRRSIESVQPFTSADVNQVVSYCRNDVATSGDEPQHEGKHVGNIPIIVELSKQVFMRASSSISTNDQHTKPGCDAITPSSSSGTTGMVSFDNIGSFEPIKVFGTIESSSYPEIYDLSQGNNIHLTASLSSPGSGEEVPSNCIKIPSTHSMSVSTAQGTAQVVIKGTPMNSIDGTGALQSDAEHCNMEQFYSSKSTWLPSNYDVLCNSNLVCSPKQAYFHHIGNRRFRILIETRVTEFEDLYGATLLLPDVSAGIARMNQFVDEVLESLPFRFLALDARVGFWRVLGSVYARKKIDHAFYQCMEVKKMQLLRED